MSRDTQYWLTSTPQVSEIDEPVYPPWMNHIEGSWQAYQTR
jgi:hypothetical protein